MQKAIKEYKLDNEKNLGAVKAQGGAGEGANGEKLMSMIDNSNSAAMMI